MSSTDHTSLETLNRIARPRRPRGSAASVVRACVWWMVAGLVMFGSVAGARASSISKEYQLKAAFLYNFTKYVEWQPGQFANDTSPIVIAVLGQDPFAGELEQLVKGRTVRGRDIVVQVIEQPVDLPDAHVVFISASAEGGLQTPLFGVPGVLTVGESSWFADRGGIIRFTVLDEKVRFEINQASAEQAGLKISGQLLKLATVIRKTR